MNKKLLLIIDLQESFINESTKFLPQKIEKLLISNKFDYIVFTKFINDDKSDFYRILNYKGCMTEKDRNIVIDTKDYRVIEKRVYTAYNDELKSYIDSNNIKTIYLCGIDTDACVLKTTLDLFENNLDVKVIEDCSMSHSGIEYHNSAINMLRKLIGNQNVIKMLGSVNND
ncbi:MAG: cysteine hydrolase [bacterium]|nr:cysteine hydrolase [bacterium]